ncbi:DUF397 domain-containing protein [Streptomyces sp. NPDC014864]|uniref:DUF397 domain-containing protein n=1 Tax=Streptomyces sp. NPDC014864 TaxID=3364924 RepID=UPI0036FF99D5
MVDPTELHWRKASYSMGNGGNCVEVADAGHTVHVRDSKDPDGPAFGFGREQWQAFLTALEHGGSWALTRPVAPSTAGTHPNGRAAAPPEAAGRFVIGRHPTSVPPPCA